MRFHHTLPLLLAFLCQGIFAEPPATQPVPLLHVHAHNDYLHTRPFFDAIERGFCSVEADIHLVEGKLFVAHDVKLIKPDRTLQSLYLNPFRDRVKANGGRVFGAGGPSVVLLIDVKGEAATTYVALKAVLKEYEPMLTTWKDDRRKEGAVTVIITGNRKLELVSADNPRLAAYDGQLVDMESNPSPQLVPWISESFGRYFQWHGKGPMPDGEKEALRTMAAKVHSQGRQLRLWGAPDNLATWTEMRAAGVDLINTDDLPGAQAFLLKELNGK